MVRIIALTGPIGSGKSSVARILEELLTNEGLDVLIIPVADGVYRASEATYKSMNLNPQKNRQLLQSIGDIGRSVDPDFWIEKIVNEITSIKSNYDYIVVPDIRYPNEISLLKNYFNAWHFKIEGSYTLERSYHSSETSMDNYNDYDLRYEYSLSSDRIARSIISHINSSASVSTRSYNHGSFISNLFPGYYRNKKVCDDTGCYYVRH